MWINQLKDVIYAYTIVFHLVKLRMINMAKRCRIEYAYKLRVCDIGLYTIV